MIRHPAFTERRTAVAFCWTAWDGPGAGIGELVAACEREAAAAWADIVSWQCEVVADDEPSRLPLVQRAIDGSDDDGALVLVAESPTLVRTAGLAVRLFRAMGVPAARLTAVRL